MERSKMSPEQSEQDNERVSPSQEETSKTIPSRTDAEIEEANKRKADKKDDKSGRKKKTSAAAIDSIINSPTESVRARRSEHNWGTVGTNVSYEGPTSTSPVGTGYNSGQSATGARINTDSEYDAGGVERTNKDEDEKNEEQKDII